LSTVLPIDKVIGRIYPVFGAVLLLACAGVGITLFTSGNIVNVPELSLQNMHPDNVPIIPGLFFTISCGALSGFHAHKVRLYQELLRKKGKVVLFSMGQ